jgi:hypothetical protein
MTRSKFITLCLLGLISTVVPQREIQAQVVPYKTKGTGVYSPLTGAYSGPGTGTHMGNHTFDGNVAVYPTAHPLVFTWASTAPQATIAANGDVLYFDASGAVELIPLDATFTVFIAVWTGDFVVTGGTGRFASAAPANEPLRVIAINDPFNPTTDPVWTFSWEVDGRIRLR